MRSTHDEGRREAAPLGPKGRCLKGVDGDRHGCFDAVEIGRPPGSSFGPGHLIEGILWIKHIRVIAGQSAWRALLNECDESELNGAALL